MNERAPEFVRSLKPFAVEEFVDLHFYRPIAHRLVPYLISFKLTPNQITTLSLLAGLLASFLVWKGFFVPGGLTALAAICLDCCDGQVARLTGQSSPLGRVMDGFFDSIWGTTFWLAILLSGYFQQRGIAVFWLMLASSISFYVHCWRFDGAKIKYLALVKPGYSDKDLDFHGALQLMKSEWGKKHFFSAFLAVCIAFQVYFFVSGTQRKEPRALPEESRIRAEKTLTPLIKKWTWLGESCHHTQVILGVFLMTLSPYPLMTVFWLILVPMNVGYFILEWQWRQAVKRLNLSSV